jgi:hypothetical protein
MGDDLVVGAVVLIAAGIVLGALGGWRLARRLAA